MLGRSVRLKGFEPLAFCSASKRSNPTELQAHIHLVIGFILANV